MGKNDRTRDNKELHISSENYYKVSYKVADIFPKCMSLKLYITHKIYNLYQEDKNEQTLMFYK